MKAELEPSSVSVEERIAALQARAAALGWHLWMKTMYNDVCWPFLIQPLDEKQGPTGFHTMGEVAVFLGKGERRAARTIAEQEATA